MKKQILVIGVGQFGMGLVRALGRKRVEVIAVDVDEKKVQAASSYAAKVYCLDATDEDNLMQLSPQTRDVCICATGDQSKEAAIICTALLKQMGVPRIIARANDDLHSRILKLVGADEVINPEWAFGERYANRVLYEDIIEEMSLGSDLVVTEFRIPAAFASQTLVALDLRRRFGVTVVAVRSALTNSVKLPNPEEVIHKDDILIVVSHHGDVERLLGKEGG